MHRSWLLVVGVFINISKIETVSREREYVSLISQIRSFYHASSVIMVQNHQTEVIYSPFNIIKELSCLGISSQATNFEKLSVMRYYYKKYLKQQLYVVILTTNETLKEMKAVMHQIQTSETSWLVIFETWKGENLLNDYCKNPQGNPFNLRFNTRMIIKCYDSILREWYSLYNNDTQVLHLATWDNTHGFKLLTSKFLYSRRNDIGGVSLRLRAYKNVDDKEVSSVFKIVMSNISEIINFKLDTIPDNYTIDMSNEIMNELESNKTDIIVSNLMKKKGRLNYADFTYPISKRRMMFCIKGTDDTTKQYLKYFEPFHYQVWMTIILSILILPIIFTMMTILLNHREISEWKMLLYDNYFNVWQMFCLQALKEFPNENPLRLSHFSIFTTALVISLVYSGSLIRCLKIQSSLPSFTTIESFIEDGTYKLTTLKDQHCHRLIKESKEGEFSHLKPFLRSDEKLPKTEIEAMNQVCTSKTALFTIKHLLSFSNMPFKCKFKCSELEKERVYTSFALSKLNPYTEIINYHINRFNTIGYLRNLNKKLYKIMKEHDTKPTNGVDTSGSELLVQVLITGIVLSLLAFLLETTFNMYYKNKKKETLKIIRKLILDEKINKFVNKNKTKLNYSKTTIKC